MPEGRYTMVEAYAEHRRDLEFYAKYLVADYLGTDPPTIPEHLRRKPDAASPSRRRPEPTRQLALFPEPGKRGGIVPQGPCQGETMEAVAISFRSADDDPDIATVTFQPDDGPTVRASVHVHDAPLGLAIGDRCTLVRKGEAWRLASVDSGWVA